MSDAALVSLLRSMPHTPGIEGIIRNVSLKNIGVIARAFDMSVGELMGYIE